MKLRVSIKTTEPILWKNILSKFSFSLKLVESTGNWLDIDNVKWFQNILKLLQDVNLGRKPVGTTVRWLVYLIKSRSTLLKDWGWAVFGCSYKKITSVGQGIVEYRRKFFALILSNFYVKFENMNSSCDSLRLLTSLKPAGQGRV